jgi:hypothetical protein
VDILDEISLSSLDRFSITPLRGREQERLKKMTMVNNNNHNEQRID